MYHAKHYAKTKKNRRRAARRKTAARVLLSLVLTACTCYAVFVFAPIPVVRYWRNIYIETAMTTAHHKWLATYFLPHSIIRGVMAGQSETVDTIGGLQGRPPVSEQTAPIQQPPAYSGPEDPEAGPTAAPEPTEAPAATPVPDILGQEALTVDQPDANGNKVLVNDREQGIVILEVKGASYTAHLALIDDPARVFVAQTPDKGARGTLICDYLQQENAVLGINANGFADEGGHGNGGEIAGLSFSRGEAWGEYKDTYVSFGFDTQNHLLVGRIDDWNAYGMRDGAQFKPALIIDGEIVTAGSNGWGLQPRTCVGQRADGAVLFLVVDGRQVGYSVGATVGDCAAVLQQYGAVNAACCDGGSSSVMAYDGALVTVPSTSMKATGRWLPDAFLVARRTENDF